MGFLDFGPTTILVFITLVLVLKQTVNALGKSKIEDHAWKTYCSVAAKMGNSEFSTIANKRAELVEINQKRKLISAQDEYAKWTKLNRQYDKLSAEVDKLADELAAGKTKVTGIVRTLITVFTVAPVWFARVWYRKTTFFYFPVGALPPYLEWILALPFGVTGGIGLTVWMFALNSVIGNIVQTIKFFSEKPAEKPQPVGSSDTKGKDIVGGTGAVKLSE